MDSGVDIVVSGVNISVLVLDIIHSGVYVYLGRRHKRFGGAVESWS